MAVTQRPSVARGDASDLRRSRTRGMVTPDLKPQDILTDPERGRDADMTNPKMFDLQGHSNKPLN
jgi:hypothetical protein